jgi:hypothetical protein
LILRRPIARDVVLDSGLRGEATKRGFAARLWLIGLFDGGQCQLDLLSREIEGGDLSVRMTYINSYFDGDNRLCSSMMGTRSFRQRRFSAVGSAFFVDEAEGAPQFCQPLVDFSRGSTEQG